MCKYTYVLVLLLLVTGTTLFVLSSTLNVTDSWQHIISDGGQEEIQCLPNKVNTTTTIRWKVFEKILGVGQSMNSSNAHFNISRHSSLIVTNPRYGSLQGLVNVTCIISGKNTSENRITYQVAFLKAPKITNTKLVYDVPDDASTKSTFSCDATGFPRPKIRWIFQNVTLASGHTRHVNTPDIPNANLTQLSDGSLAVVSTNRHGGFGVDVVCFANNSNGNTQKLFLVRFLKAPTILTKEYHIPRLQGVASVLVPCEAEGYPRPFIQWMFDNKITLNSSVPKMDGLKCQISLGKTLLSTYKVYENGTLYINNPYCVEIAKYRSLSCEASSFLGRDTKSHKFSVGKLTSFSFEIILVNASQFGNDINIAARAERVFHYIKDSLLLCSFNVTSVNVM